MEHVGPSIFSQRRTADSLEHSGSRTYVTGGQTRTGGLMR